MADETVIISSPGLVTWGSGTFGDGSYGGQELSLGLLQGTTTVTVDANISVTGTQLAFAINAVAIRIDQEPQVQGTQINLIVSSTVASIPETVTVTGSQINLDEGSVTTDFQPDAGWGIKGWGIVPWGEEDDVTVVVTGRRLNTFVHPVDTNADGNESVNVDEDDDIVIYLNSVTTSADANVAVLGSQINLITGSVAITGNASINVTGSQRNIQIDSVTTTIGVSVDVQGTQINFLPIGQAIEVITVDVFPTGSRINVTEGLAGAIITGDANVSVTGTQINLTVNQVGVSADGNISVVADENQINLAIGNEDISADANVNVTGSRINLSAGQLTYAVGYDVTGSRINIAIGNETTSANANVNVTGIRLNISTGSANVTAWAEVQTGANNIWTPVDLAA
jgi:hypothetical protein